MVPCLDCRIVVCTATGLLAIAVAGLLSGTAHADDALGTPASHLTALADTVSAVTAGGTAAAAIQPVAEAASAPLVQHESAPAQSDAPTPSETVVSVGQTPDETDGSAPIQEVASHPDIMDADITAPHGDISTDTPAPEPQQESGSESSADAPVPEPDTEDSVLSAPGVDPPAASGVTANVNVSVRIGSPGDNGSVTQVNVLRASNTAPTAAAPLPAQQIDGNPAIGTPADDASDTWYWRWDCVGIPTVPAISSNGSGGAPFPSSWTWIWNCGDNSNQYQEGKTPRYQQVNGNIAIRISSPGNDGPVSQVNAIAQVNTTVAAVGAVAVIRVAPPMPVPAPSDALLTPSATPALVSQAPQDAAPTLTDTWTPPAATDITLSPTPAGPATDASETGDRPWTPGILGAHTATEGVPYGAGRRAGPVGRATSLSGFGAPSPRPGPVTMPRAPAAWHPATPAPAPSARTTKLHRTTKAMPGRRAQLPTRAPVLQVSGVSVAAAGGGGSSGSGLPALLMLPFVAALLDLARRVALDHATLPSGYRRRAPDRPG